MTNQPPPRIIRARPIEAASFAPYGQLLELPEEQFLEESLEITLEKEEKE